MTKHEAEQQGFKATNHIAFSAMYEHLSELLKKNKIKAAKEAAASYENHPLIWYQKGGFAVAVQENEL